MDARTLTRLGSCLLVAVLATGCAPLRGSRPDLFAPFGPGNSTDPSNVTPASGTIPGGTVIAAGGAAQPPAPGGQQPAPGAPLPVPRPMPAVAGWAKPNDPQPPVMVPPVPPAGTRPLHPHANPDPHVRNTPTAAGGRLALGPGEVPTDRIIELTLHLDLLLSQNRELLARVKELETAGIAREQALVEAAREVDSVTAEAAKTRAALQTQIITLQGRVKQLEEEDVIFLKAVIEALGRLFPPEKKP